MFQICFYFDLKFRKLSIETRKLLNKRNVKTSTYRKIYLIIRRHNIICYRFKRFNDFWKFHLQFELIFFLILIWFLTYEVAFDYKLVFYNRIFFFTWQLGFTSILSFVIYMVYMVSLEVNKITLRVNFL